MLQCILGATNQNPFMAPINNELVFRGDLFVTIAEIHTLILDVCLCIQMFIFLDVSFFIDSIIWISLKRLKMVCSKMTVLL